jgi:hypothetical protein
MNKNELKQPFFAQFLEAEKSSSQETNYHTTRPYIDGDQTHKYPSDNDENPPDA